MSETALRLIVFDCDGTLVDSQPLIARTMAATFERHGLAPPTVAETKAIVGMELSAGITALLGDDHDEDTDAMAVTYRDIFKVFFAEPGALPRPFTGLPPLLDRLDGGANLLGVCTGRSRGSLEPILALNGLGDRFVTLQTGDRHPGKPHPAMLEAALDEAGVPAARALMIGDASFDMEMSVNAGVAAIGVTWGSHPAGQLRTAGARAIAEDVATLGQMIDDWLAETA